MDGKRRPGLMNHEFVRLSEFHLTCQCKKCNYVAQILNLEDYDPDEHPECEFIQISEVMED